MSAVKKPRAKRAPAKAVEPAQEIIAYKGFDKNLQCRGFQYEVGKKFVHAGPVIQCGSGFHVCQNPLDVLDFYGIGDGNRFARVAVGGKIDRSDDKKWACAELTVQAELRLPDFIKAGIQWIAAACKVDDKTEVSSGDYATNASSGDYATNASSGNSAKNASSGDYATNASSGHSATNASSGHSATNASSGDYATNEATGEHSVIVGAGRDTLAKGAKGVWISLAEYAVIDGTYHCIGFASGQAGFDGVPADAWLRAEGGKLVRA